ncbi:MAG TPA: MqnA/MqnD/SBP family protein [Tepidisphaeraceae bacterium]|jgi:1,4-dihydroxy-6-naphthoate synthase|nr:MqnA/MqnD/SBP family protein [Tepidisphaeraceae bacterium]
MMEQRLLRLGHSPDPDDAFMFYGLAKNLIPTGKWQFEHVLQDIQTLNQRAMKGELEITAISIHAYPYVADKYALTSCGSSMGDNYGPMLVCRKDRAAEFQISNLKSGNVPDMRGKKIAIPGKLTTAFLALQLALGKAGEAFDYEVVMFDEIPKYVMDGKADAGLLIHEGQLTYADAGLHLMLDTGIWWHEKTGLPLPLGGNCIRKDLGKEAMQEVTDILWKSIRFSLDHRKEAVEYALQFGRDLNRELADKFVGMYVNQWTLDYGPRGREAITRILTEGAKAGLVPDAGEIEYVTVRR